MQPPLFPADSKIIGFDEYLPAEAARPRAHAARRPRSAGPKPSSGQISFDFERLPAGAAGAAVASRRTEAALLGRRSFACLVDLGMALALGVLPFLLVARVSASEAFRGGFPGLLLAIAAWFILAVYHLLHAVCGRPTPGQRLARLRLVTMDGRPGTPSHRVMRVLFNLIPPACLLGSVWAAATEDKHSWADQVTRTRFVPAGTDH